MSIFSSLSITTYLQQAEASDGYDGGEKILFTGKVNLISSAASGLLYLDRLKMTEETKNISWLQNWMLTWFAMALVVLGISVAGIAWCLFSSPEIPRDYNYALRQMTFTRIGGKAPENLNAQVRSNMYTLQIAVESYSTDNNGSYPAEINTALKTYFPGGSNGVEGEIREGNVPVNPFTDQPGWPVIGSVTSASVAGSSSLNLQPGQIEFSPIKNTSGNVVNYIIRGCGNEGKPIADRKQGGTLVLWNKSVSEGR